MTGVSLVDGWLYITVLLLGVVAFAVPADQAVPLVVAVGGSAGAGAVRRRGLEHRTLPRTDYVGEELKPEIDLWIGIAFAGIGLAIGYMFASTWWQRVLAIIAAVLVVAAAGNQINDYYQQFPRFGDLLGVSSDQQIAGPPPISTGSGQLVVDHPDPARPAHHHLDPDRQPTSPPTARAGPARSTSPARPPGSRRGRVRSTTRPRTSPTTPSRCRC